MNKILVFFGMLLLIADMFHGISGARAVVLPYFRHPRYLLRRPLLFAQAVPIADMDGYLSGTIIMTQKRSQPDIDDFDYVDDFDPTQVFL
ncbi:hypothetical protein X798_00973 [Onchocerca flexuosa]|uniref:Uncharacterized protein n=1 Tax=Onchocerca flexuosa TaxID=387005 RepID=A0A238C2U2_9BILA|nr:hypothetical protein X798_00973 [Onchocerca flexuosa]